MDYAKALARVQELDPHADHADGAPDVLLVANRWADEVLTLFPGSYRDDSDTHWGWTRIVLPDND